MSESACLFNQMMTQLRKVFSAVFPHANPQDDFPSERFINEVNAVIQHMPKKDQAMLPTSLVKEMAKNATLPPDQVIDTKKPIELQSFLDETLLFIFYINTILTEVKKANPENDEELHNAHVRAAKRIKLHLEGEFDLFKRFS